jgi:hypothetical protein
MKSRFLLERLFHCIACCNGRFAIHNSLLIACASALVLTLFPNLTFVVTGEWRYAPFAENINIIIALSLCVFIQRATTELRAEQQPRGVV